MDAHSSPRAENGRLAPGNPGGPGRAKGRGYELLQAAQDAITPEHVSVMMRKALKLGLEGTLAAMKFDQPRIGKGDG